VQAPWGEKGAWKIGWRPLSGSSHAEVTPRLQALVRVIGRQAIAEISRPFYNDARGRKGAGRCPLTEFFGPAARQPMWRGT